VITCGDSFTLQVLWQNKISNTLQEKTRFHKSKMLIWFKQVIVIVHFVKNKEKRKREKDKSFVPYYSRDLIMTKVELCE